jgi:hypothetical protein
MSADEGGMNLSMPEATIRRLTLRGEYAAERLVQAYTQEPADPLGVSWDAHRWVRLRAALPAIGTLLQTFKRGWTEPSANGARTYPELVARGRDDPPGSYRIGSGEQRELARRIGDGLSALAAEVAAGPGDLTGGAPHPESEARLVPPDVAADGESG